MFVYEMSKCQSQRADNCFVTVTAAYVLHNNNSDFHLYCCIFFNQNTLGLTVVLI